MSRAGNVVTHYISEEFPSEFKSVLNSTQLKKVGDLLSTYGFDVQRTNFGSATEQVNNRDPRLKDPKYISFFMGSNLHIIDPAKKDPVIYGSSYEYDTNSWSKFIEGKTIWILDKKNVSKTTQMRADRVVAKTGAIDLVRQENIEAMQKDITYLQKQIENGINDIERETQGMQNPDRIARHQKYIKDYQERLAHIGDLFDKSGFRRDTNKYTKIKQELIAKAKTEDAKKLLSSGGIYDQLVDQYTSSTADIIILIGDLQKVPQITDDKGKIKANYQKVRAITNKIRSLSDNLLDISRNLSDLSGGDWYDNQDSAIRAAKQMKELIDRAKKIQSIKPEEF